MTPCTCMHSTITQCGQVIPWLTFWPMHVLYYIFNCGSSWYCWKPSVLKKKTSQMLGLLIFESPEWSLSLTCVNIWALELTTMTAWISAFSTVHGSVELSLVVNFFWPSRRKMGTLGIGVTPTLCLTTDSIAVLIMTWAKGLTSTC